MVNKMRRKRTRQKIRELLRENGTLSTHELHAKLKNFNFNPSPQQIASICSSEVGIIKTKDIDYSVTLQMGKVRIRCVEWSLIE